MDACDLAIDRIGGGGLEHFFTEAVPPPSLFTPRFSAVKYGFLRAVSQFPYLDTRLHKVKSIAQ